MTWQRRLAIAKARWRLNHLQWQADVAAWKGDTARADLIAHRVLAAKWALYHLRQVRL